MSRRNFHTSRESIILMKSKENLNGVLCKFEVQVDSTIKRQSMKKSLAIQDAKSNFNLLKKIKSDLIDKLSRQKEQRDLPIRRLKEQFKDITGFKNQLDQRFKSLDDEFRKQKNRGQQLEGIYEELKQRVQEKLKDSDQLKNSQVISYTKDHESKTKEANKLLHLLNKQMRKQKKFQKQYISKKQQVMKTKEILSNMDYRISQFNLHKKLEEALKEINEHQKILKKAEELFYHHSQ